MVISITMPKELIERIDKQAEATYTNRSNYIRQACVAYIKAKQEEAKK